jgi:hypothetical protein
MAGILAARSGRPRCVLKAYTTASADSFGLMMTTRLEKTLKRQLTLDGRTFIVAVSPEGLKITLKGKRKGQELRWSDLVSGEAALAVALNASVGRFESPALRAKRSDPSAPAPKSTRGSSAPAPKKSTRGTRRPDGRSASKRHNVPSKSPRR